MSQYAISTPSRARERQISLPIPLSPPVTRAFLPSNPRFIFSASDPKSKILLSERNVSPSDRHIQSLVHKEKIPRGVLRRMAIEVPQDLAAFINYQCLAGCYG